jgi:hypothetical protein
MIKPQDLRGEARRMFDVWRSVGLSESATIQMLLDDGVIPMSNHDQLVANFMSLGLSASEAQIAADGRGGRSRTPTGHSTSAASIAEETVESRALVDTVRELAEAALRRGGVSPRRGERRDLAAAREAAWKVIIRLPPSVAATMWATRVVEAAWPGVQLVDPHRPSGSSSHGSASMTVRS